VPEPEWRRNRTGGRTSQEDLKMRTWTLAGPLLMAGFGLAATAGIGSAQQHRHADAHEHGRGSLNIAIEGTKVSMELEAPGADIVGFEHKAKTKQQKAAIEKAEQRLMVGESLFKLPAAAGCTLVTSGAALEGAGHSHDHDAKAHGHKDSGHKARGDKGAKHDNAKAADDDHEHSGFRAEYVFECTSPASLTSIAFDYFKAFAGAEKLDVTVITPKGQSKFEVTRAKPRIDLGGMM
jgi:hypothetical protein